MWVENAQRDHADFVNKLRERDVDVVELHDLLAHTMADPMAREWLLDRKIVANEVGLGLMETTRAYLETLEPTQLAKCLIGGLATADLPDEYRFRLHRAGPRVHRRRRVSDAAAAQHALHP